MNFKILLDSSTKVEFLANAREVVKTFGFTDFSIHMIGTPAHLGLSTIPAELNQALVSNEIIQKHFELGGDPFRLRFLTEFVCPFKHDLFPNLEEALDASGFADGVIFAADVSQYSKKALVGLFSADLSGNEITDVLMHKSDIVKFLVSSLAHFSIDKMPSDLLGEYFELKRREIAMYDSKAVRLLRTVVQGKTLKEASDELCIGLDTANKHMKHAKDIFQARNTAQAVYRAVKSGVID